MASHGYLMLAAHRSGGSPQGHLGWGAQVARSDHEANVRFPAGSPEWRRLLRVEESTGRKRGAILRGLVSQFVEQWEELELARQAGELETAASQARALATGRDALRRALRERE